MTFNEVFQLIAKLLLTFVFGAVIGLSRERDVMNAATIWCTACIGLAFCMDMYLICFVAAASVYFLLVLHKISGYKKWMDSIRRNDNGDNDIE